MSRLTRKLKEVGAFINEACRQSFEGPFYNLSMGAYGLGIKVASVRNTKAAQMTAGHREVWNRLQKGLEPGARYIWVHAASLGEFEQGRPLIERIKRERPEYKILLTFFSPSGYEIRKNYNKADLICYLPIDTAANARRFVETVRPEKAVFVKYEFWRNYLRQLNVHTIPTYLISGIFLPQQRFFKRGGSWYRAWLRWFDRLFVQDRRSAELLASVGIDRVTVAGDTRFDRVADIRDSARRHPLLDRFAGWKGEISHSTPVLMAGSSWPADEDVYTPWINAHLSVKLVVAPHEFDAERLKVLKGRFVNGVVLLSEAERNPELLDKAQVLIIDCFGLLSSAYAYADVAYVGGGFGTGIHNINEAAAHGIPVIFGPKHDKFLEAEELKTLGGGIAISSREGFETNASRLLFDPAERERRGRWAGEYIAEKTGATGIIFDALFPPGT